MGAWIETLERQLFAWLFVVAPRVGAWIETGEARGSDVGLHGKSHPVWVRGLKRLFCFENESIQDLVAPRVGAWIETVNDQLSIKQGLCRTPCGCVD